MTAGFSAPPDFPPPDLGEAILRTIAEVTGRPVERSSVYEFSGDSIEVTAVLQEDGSVWVDMSDPGLHAGEAG